MNKTFAMLIVLLLGGCVALPLSPDSPSSPASSQAPESKPHKPDSPLVEDEVTSAVVARLSETRAAAERPGAAHDMSGMEGMQGIDHSQMDHSKMPKAEATDSQSKQALDAEMKKTADEMKEVSSELKKKADAAKTGKQPSASPSVVIYTCPMHPEVQQPNPGKCPKCGMTLVKKEPK
jgi:rubrerythrin